MKNHKLFIIILLLCCFEIGCTSTMSRTTHAISYGDTPAMRTDMDFKYIRYGVTGSSKAVYDFRGGGHVKTGLLAGAKANMMQQHPLQINQAYINMSVDILNTETRNVNMYGLSTFCMVYLMVAKAVNFQLPTFRLPLPIPHLSLCSVRVQL